MHASIAATHPIQTRRVRRSETPVLPAAQVATPVDQSRTLPLRAAVGMRVSAPSWMWIIGGGVVGGLLLGPLGAVGGALAGLLLTR